MCVKVAFHNILGLTNKALYIFFIPNYIACSEPLLQNHGIASQVTFGITFIDTQ